MVLEYPKINIQPPGPKAQHWIERSKKCEALKEPEHPSFPSLVISKTSGVYVTDVDGNIYLDFTSGGQTGSIGHRHPKVISSVKKQIEEVGLCSSIGVTNEKRVILAEKLQTITRGWLSNIRVAYCNTGSDAAEFSIQIARAYTNRPGIMAFQGSFHGGSLGALSITMGNSLIKRGRRPLISDVAYAPFAYCYRCPFRQEYPSCDFSCVDFFEYVLHTVLHPSDIAALFTEPIQVPAGVIVPPKEYFKRITKICREYGILLVDDEVPTCLGRTGKMFGLEHWKVKPDLMFMAKPIACGLSLGAILGREDVMRFFRGGGSYSGNPVYCTAASTFIDLISEENLIGNALKVGQHMIKRLMEIQEKYPLIGDVRGKGLIIGVELVRNEKTKMPATEETKELINRAFKNGLLIISGGTYGQVLRLSPPLILTIEQADIGIDIIERSIKEVST
jgi:4-aminobutyrate aminotransferase